MTTSDRIAAHIVAAALFTVATAMPYKPVQAATNADEPPSVTLRFSATDLGTPQGVAALYRRIRGAAATVCGQFDNALLEEKQQWDLCVNHAVAQAVLSLHNDNLSAYHWRQIGGVRWPRIQAPAPAALAAR